MNPTPSICGESNLEIEDLPAPPSQPDTVGTDVEQVDAFKTYRIDDGVASEPPRPPEAQAALGFVSDKRLPLEAVKRPPSGAALFIELDGLRARAAWIRVVRGVPDIVRLPSIEAFTLDVALAAWQPWLALGRGRPVVILAPEVLRAVVGIPVDPQRPLTTNRMRTLLTGELSALASRHTWSRSMGATLVGMGILSPEQVTTILSEMVSRRMNGGGGGSQLRFGEIAQELGLVTAAQVSDALVRQQVPISSENNPVLGWCPSRGEPSDGRHLWQVVAVGRGVRDKAAAAVRAHGLRLSAMLPVHGAVVGLLPASASGSVVEWHHGLIGLTVLVDGRVQECYTHAVADCLPPVDLVERMVGNAPGTVWFDDRGSASADGFSLPFTDLPGAHKSLAGMVGAALLWSNPGQRARTAMVPGVDPPPAWYKRPLSWVGLTGGVAALLLLTCELRMRAWHDDLRARIRTQDERSTLLEEVRDLQQRLQTLTLDQRFWLDLLPARERGLQALFAALRQATPNTVTLQDVQEQLDGTIRIKAFGTVQEDAQQFRLALADRLQAQGWKTGALTLTGVPGRFDVNFSVSGPKP